MPFTTSSNPGALVLLRCNADVQYVTRSLPDTANAAEPTSLDVRTRKDTVVKSLKDAFRASHNADYYVTKYQTKPQQSLTPLLEVFAGAVRRFHLEQEEAKNEVTNAGQNPDSSKAQHIASIQDPNRQKAQRLLVKMSTAMNKCYWHSLCEISVHLLCTY